jgi:hypothetical protein
MALLPVAVKRRLVNRADLGGNPLVHLVAFAVARTMYLKLLSTRRGLIGKSVPWRVVWVFVHSPGTFKKFFGKQPDQLGTWKVASNDFVNVINAKPMSKKQLKKSGTSKKARRDAIVAAAVAATRKKEPDAKIVVKTK